MLIIITYEFGSLAQSEEQEFLILVNIGSVHRLHLDLFLIVMNVLPLDGALDLTLEVSWEPSRNQRHLDVLMGVWFKLTRHWLKLEVISTHKARLLEVELHLLSLMQVVKNNKSV